MSRNAAIALTTLAIAAYLLWGVHYAGVDLWWDEISSLSEYALVELKSTLTTYPDPNNHNLFNLVNNVWTRVLGARDLFGGLEHVVAMRLLQWLVGLGSLLYVFLVGRRFLGRGAGVLALVFLVTCMPFLNFAMQLRGYALSMFLAAGLIYHTCALRRSRSGIHTILIAIFSFALLYTIPSNVYFLIALCTVPLWHAVRKRDRRWGRRMLIAMAVGAGLAFLAYLPVLDGLLHNRFVTARPADRFFILSERLPAVSMHLLSFRYALLPTTLIGLWFALRDRKRTLAGSELAAPLLALYAIPFCLSSLRNDAAFERTFILLAPVTALIFAGTASWTIASLRQTRFTRSWLGPILGLYALVSLPFTHGYVQHRLDGALVHGVREQNILVNYYQSGAFRPRQTAARLAAAHAEHPGTVILVDDLDRVSWSAYLGNCGIPCYALVSVTPQAGGSDMSPRYSAVFQESPGTDEDLRFFRMTMELAARDPEDNLTPVLYMVRRHRATDRYYLVTAFEKKNLALLRRWHADLKVDPLTGAGGAGAVLLLTPRNLIE